MARKYFSRKVKMNFRVDPSSGLLEIQIDFRNFLALLYRVSLAPYWNGIKNTENFKLTLPAEKMHFYGKEYSRHGS